MKGIIIIAMLSILIVACEKDAGISNYDECVAAGNPVRKSMPPQCLADGKTFVKEADKPIGGDKDSHGCIPSAGYSWCEAKQKCLRTWEEPCAASDISACTTDSDCIPMPGCHPTECINKKYASDYKQPEMCTAMYSYEAAYSAEDCACRDSVCVNKNKGQTDDSTVTKPYDFEQCVAEGNPVMESYPRKCSSNGITYTEEIVVPEGRHVCTAEESLATACTMEYAPVCGEIGLNMGKTIYQTFGNGCAACAAMKTVAYTQGECPEETKDICYDSEGNSMTLQEAAVIAKASECGDNFKTECECPENYIKEGDACNPKCFYSNPACMIPSLECQKTVSCNSGTGTYWIDLSTKKEGCSPACVVDIKTRTAEINWRCTGAMSEPGSAG